VDFEEGVWVRRLAAGDRLVPELDGYPQRDTLFRAAAIYQEVDRIHARGALDAVVVPDTGGEGLVCALDDRFPTLRVPLWGRLPIGPTGADLCRAIIHGSEAPTHRPSVDKMCEQIVVERLAAALAQGGLAPAAACRAADTLLDPACYPVDYPASALRLWGCPDEAFLRGLFPLLLRREVDAPTEARYLRLLRRGMPRRAVVEHIARSREAAAGGLPLAWLVLLRRLTPTPQLTSRVGILDRLRTLATRLAWAARRWLRWGRGAR
jgi:hypothetical protein